VAGSAVGRGRRQVSGQVSAAALAGTLAHTGTPCIGSPIDSPWSCAIIPCPRYYTPVPAAALLGQHSLSTLSMPTTRFVAGSFTTFHSP
jgi:hypothetical protein